MNMARIRAFLTITVLTVVVTAPLAGAVPITLDYNGFNPGTDVNVFTNESLATGLVATHAAAVAGDTETTFVFDLPAADTYRIDLWGNSGGSSARPGYYIEFVFDGTDIDSVGTGSDKITGFSPNDTTLTLWTVPLYIDPNGFNPPADNPDGYKLVSSRSTTVIPLAGGNETFANGGRVVTNVNNMEYKITYSGLDAMGTTFSLTGGVVGEKDDLLDEGTTTDSSGNESGDTHQLVRLDPKEINIDFNGLSHAVGLEDSRNRIRLGPNPIPAEFNGTVDLLHYSYEFDYARHSVMSFSVDASGNIPPITDDRATSSGNTITFNTTGVAFDVGGDENWALHAKSSAGNSNTSTLLSGLDGNQVLTLGPAIGGVYYPTGLAGADSSEPRDAFKVDYDSGSDSYSLTKYDELGNADPGHQSITLYHNGNENVVVSIYTPPPEGTVFMVR